MTELNKQTIQYLSKLSRINCSDKDQEELLKDLENILSYFEELQQVDTSNVPVCNHVLADIVNVMRDDVPEPAMPRETFLANAPAHTGGLIRVPPVLKNQDEM